MLADLANKLVQRMVGRTKIFPSQIRWRDNRKKRRKGSNTHTQKYHIWQGEMLGYFPNKEVIAKLPKWVPGIENQHTKVQMDLTLTFK